MNEMKGLNETTIQRTGKKSININVFVYQPCFFFEKIKIDECFE